MTRLIITGLKSKENWAVHKYDDYRWSAWIRDVGDPETGAPLLEGSSFEDVVDKIKSFEQGAAYAMRID